MKSRKIMFLSVAAIMSLVACSNSQPSSKESEKEPVSSVEPAPVDGLADDEVPVYILTGQSNMEGNTRFSESNLRQVFADLEIEMAIDKLEKDLLGR